MQVQQVQQELAQVPAAQVVDPGTHENTAPLKNASGLCLWPSCCGARPAGNLMQSALRLQFPLGLRDYHVALKGRQKPQSPGISSPPWEPFESHSGRRELNRPLHNHKELLGQLLRYHLQRVTKVPKAKKRKASLCSRHGWPFRPKQLDLQKALQKGRTLQ